MNCRPSVPDRVVDVVSEEQVDRFQQGLHFFGKQGQVPDRELEKNNQDHGDDHGHDQVGGKGVGVQAETQRLGDETDQAVDQAGDQGVMFHGLNSRIIWTRPSIMMAR